MCFELDKFCKSDPTFFKPRLFKLTSDFCKSISVFYHWIRMELVFFGKKTVQVINFLSLFVFHRIWGIKLRFRLFETGISFAIGYKEVECKNPK